MAQTQYNYVISTDTLNGNFAGKLQQEIANSAIVIAVDYLETVGDALNIFMKDALSAGEETILTSVVAAHDGVELVAPEVPKEVIITSEPTFTAKTVGALKLYTRATGKVHAVTVGVNNLLFSIPFAQMKFNGLEIMNSKLGETVNLKVLDTVTGTVTTVPNYVLNQFGFDLNLPEGFFRWLSTYDADMFMGLQILLEYTAIEARDLRVNYVIHELKA